MSEQILFRQFDTDRKDGESDGDAHDFEGDFVGDVATWWTGCVAAPVGWVEEVQCDGACEGGMAVGRSA